MTQHPLPVQCLKLLHHRLPHQANRQHSSHLLHWLLLLPILSLHSHIRRAKVPLKQRVKQESSGRGAARMQLEGLKRIQSIVLGARAVHLLYLGQY